MPADLLERPVPCQETPSMADTSSRGTAQPAGEHAIRGYILLVPPAETAGLAKLLDFFRA
jgi:hypothetical protein